MRDSQAKEDAPAKIPDRTFSAPNMKFNRLLFFSEYFASQCSDLESATRTIGRYGIYQSNGIRMHAMLLQTVSEINLSA
jgi:hypothetical protein